MVKPVEFWSIVEAVLERRLSVDCSPQGQPWPVLATVDQPGSVTVLMHRDLPGATVLAGEVGGEFFLTGCFSASVFAHVARHRAEWFSFTALPEPEAMVPLFFDVVVAAMNGRKVDESAFRFIEGAEGAQFLRELKRVCRESVPQGATIN